MPEGTQPRFASFRRDFLATHPFDDNLLPAMFMVDIPDIDFLTRISVLLAVVEVSFNLIGMLRVDVISDTPDEVAVMELVRVRELMPVFRPNESRHSAWSLERPSMVMRALLKV